MSTRWVGTAVMTARMLVYFGSVGITERHAHHAVQIALSAEPLMLCDGHDASVVGHAALIPRDVAHSIERPMACALMVYLDPEDEIGRRLALLPATALATSWIDAAAPLAAFSLQGLLLEPEALEGLAWRPSR